MKRRQAVPVHEFPALLPAGNMVEIGGYVMQYRYAKPVTQRMNCTKWLISLAFIKLVPVAGLEPARLFTVPGF